MYNEIDAIQYNNTTYISIEKQWYSLNQCDQYLTLKHYNETEKILSEYQLKQLKRIISATAIDIPEPIPLRTYQQQHNNILYNAGNHVISIDKSGYNIIEHNNQFQYIPLSINQPLPKKNNLHKNIFQLLSYFTNNISSIELYVIRLISLFFPGIQIPAMILKGDAGSGKTTLSRITKSLFDPSESDVISSLQKIDDLILYMKYSQFAVIDNVGFITPELSNLLCSIITHATIMRRKLYTDSDMVITKLAGTFDISTINLGGAAVDLLDRSIELEFDRLPESERKTEIDIKKYLDANKSFIMHEIYHIISEVLALEDIEIECNHRLAGWYIIARKIAIVLDCESTFMQLMQDERENKYTTAIEKLSQPGRILMDVLENMQHGDILKKHNYDLLNHLSMYESRINNKEWNINNLLKDIRRIKKYLIENNTFEVNSFRDSTHRGWEFKKK